MSKPLADMPLLGTGLAHLRAMRDDRLGQLTRMNDGPLDAGRVDFLFGDVVVVNSPELLHDVLIAKAKSFEKSPILRSALYPLAGNGLFTSEGELWKTQRRLMAPMFQHASLRPFAEDMTASAARAAREWRDGQRVDITRETTRVTMAIAGKTLFGEDMFSEADALGAALTTALDWVGTESSSMWLIAQARSQIGLELLADHAPSALASRLRSVADRMRSPVLFPGQKTRELRAALELLEARVARMIAERRKDVGARRDLLSLLLSARDEDGQGMSERQVRDEVLTLFVAGHETTATALAWAMMLLGQHPDVYARVRAEVDALGRAPTFEDLPRLSLSTRVFKESLRLYPPAYVFGRVTIAPVEVGGYLLPKGTVVLVSPYTVQRRPDLWPDPSRFDPDRFLPEAEAARAKTAYIPFSAGPRTCIGNHFALMEGPLVLGTFFHHADFTLEDARGAAPAPMATLRPKGGISMRVRLRSKPETRASAAPPAR
jgi:cytochrome P450